VHERLLLHFRFDMNVRYEGNKTKNFIPALLSM
jgi:hypothetical protein